MRRKTTALISPIFIVLILVLSEYVYPLTPNASDSLDPGMASGKLSVNNQTFYIKHAYSKKTQNKAGKTTFLVLLTNHPFPQDLSKLSRFELNRYAVRYEIEGVAIGIDENQNLIFTDVLRITGTIVNAEFEPGPKKVDLVEGRVYTQEEIDDSKNKIHFDISFNAI